MRPPHLSLTTRVVLLVVVACLVTAGVGLALTTALIRPDDERPARATLARLADLAASSTGPRAHATAGDALAALRIRSVRVTPSGGVVGEDREAVAAVTPALRDAVLQGAPVSVTSHVGADVVLVEGRPAADGGVVLVERRSDALALVEADLRRTVWALVAALAVTTTLGVLVSRRLVRPLRETSAAARALAAGRRDVWVPVGGPREIAELAAAVNGLTQALDVSERRQRRFLMSVSHDLRTPLTAVLGYAESLRTRVVEGRDAVEFAAGIEDEARRLHHMVDDLLDLSRLDADDLRVELTDVDLGALVYDAARAWAAPCTLAGSRMVLQAPDHPVAARTDGARLRQLLDGLLDNAVRLTPAGGTVVLGLYPGGPTPGQAAHTVVEVRDSGPGLTDDDLVVAFEPGVLRQRYRGRRPGGAGLGLAIVRGLASRLGVGLWAGHAPEGGARFTLVVPAP